MQWNPAGGTSLIKHRNAHVFVRHEDEIEVILELEGLGRPGATGMKHWALERRALGSHWEVERQRLR